MILVSGATFHLINDMAIRVCFNSRHGSDSVDLYVTGRTSHMDDCRIKGHPEISRKLRGLKEVRMTSWIPFAPEIDMILPSPRLRAKHPLDRPQYHHDPTRHSFKIHTCRMLLQMAAFLAGCICIRAFLRPLSPTTKVVVIRPTEDHQNHQHPRHRHSQGR